MPRSIRLPAFILCLSAPLLAGAAVAQEGADAMAGAMAAEDPPVTGSVVQTVPPALAAGLTITPAEGEAYTVAFSSDGTFATDTGGAGGWTLRNGYLCLSDTQGALLCSIIDEAAAPGDAWTVTNPNGDVTTYAIPSAQ